MTDELLLWFDQNQRDLPWRKTKDPYAIWVSEIMLQQTQVQTVIPYWERWMERFPTIQSLAISELDEALALWQGLGYYSRCRNLIKGAQFVLENGLPETADQWQKVPGIGRYTAGAIASIAQNLQAPLVDGNVGRVYSRLNADPSEHDQMLKNAWEWAENRIKNSRPGDWNQALMELGATICTPKNPTCSKCPVKEFCKGHQLGNSDSYPTPKLRAKTVDVLEARVIHLCNGKIGLTRSPESDWWRGMWILPATDNLDSLSIGTIKYVVTHHRITASIFVETDTNKMDGVTYFEPHELPDLPIPAPHRRALKLAI